MTDRESECRVCKQSILKTGNYSLVIHPAKRVPKRAIKLNILDTSNVAWGLNKFQKYLLKRAIPKNYCEIKCGSCGTTCEFPMVKPKLLCDRRTPVSKTSVIRKQRKKKTPKDVNAGLIIPKNFQPSTGNKYIPQLSSMKQSAHSQHFNNAQKQGDQKQVYDTGKRRQTAPDVQRKLLLTRNILQRNLFSKSDQSSNSSPLDTFLSK